VPAGAALPAIVPSHSTLALRSGISTVSTSLAGVTSVRQISSAALRPSVPLIEIVTPSSALCGRKAGPEASSGLTAVTRGFGAFVSSAMRMSGRSALRP
jgi:hypothetical protein